MFSAWGLQKFMVKRTPSSKKKSAELKNDGSKMESIKVEPVVVTSFKCTQCFSFALVMSALLLFGAVGILNFDIFQQEKVLTTISAVFDGDRDSCETRSPSSRQLVIASHGRLFAYNIDTEEEEPLHLGGGLPAGSLYYSIFPSLTPNTTFYCALRGDLDKGDKDFIVEISLETRKVVGTIQTLPSTSFSHEVVKFNDTLYCADTGHGSLNVLSYPSFTLRQKHSLFLASNHLNTISPEGEGKAWLTFHNQHLPSFVVLLDTETGEILKRIENIGFQAHSWLEWKPHLRVYLSSKEASLCIFDLRTNVRTVVYTSKDKRQMFLKGLAVVDNVAYFGESEMKDRRGRESVACALVAVDLISRQIVFHRPRPGSIGLINTISFLNVEDGTYKAQATFPARGIPKMCSTLKLYEETAKFAHESGYAYGRFPKGVNIVQLPFRVDSLSALQQDVSALATKFGWTLRPDVNNYFILLVTQHGMEHDQSNVGPFKPVPGRLDIAPNIRKLFWQLGVVIGRTRLMMIKPGEEVKSHFDRTNHFNFANQPDVNSGYWGRRFRIHIPIQTHLNVTFKVGQSELHMEAGKVYIFDNSKMHQVRNLSNQTRIHLVIDTVGSPRFFRSLQRAKRIPTSASGENAFELAQFPFSQDEVTFLYEDWADAPVFSPMPASTLQTYFNSQVLPLVNQVNEEQVRVMLLSFLKLWSSQPTTSVWSELLLPAICSQVVLKNGYSLIDALEPIARMTLYTCVRKEQEFGSFCVASHHD